MMRRFKNRLYFFVARYFWFWASLRLRRWNPTIVVVTGSTGKTTLLHMITSQLGRAARYSLRANSTFGIAFDILGLHRVSLEPLEWLGLFVKAPFCAWKAAQQERVYVVEADCDRPYEGKFLSTHLKPHITLLTNTGSSHTERFDALVQRGAFSSVEDAVAYEFGFFLQNTRDLVVIGGDSQGARSQLGRTTVRKIIVQPELSVQYRLAAEGTEFVFKDGTARFAALLPPATATSVCMVRELVTALQMPFAFDFPGFELPPGRSSLFAGLRGSRLIDSSYNATPDGVAAMLSLFTAYPASKKWLVIGDMIELGASEQALHEKLADQIAQGGYEKIICVGSRVARFTAPRLMRDAAYAHAVEVFERPDEALAFLKKSIVGNEVILFKGARFLEGVVEPLLQNPADVERLCRREPIWSRRRALWGV